MYIFRLVWAIFSMPDKRTFFLHQITFRFLNLQSSDTAYPRFKSRLVQSELECFYSVTDVELAYCDSATRSNTTRLGLVLLLKTYQRLGYFVTSEQVPNAIAEHVAFSMSEPYDRESLRQYPLARAPRGLK